MIYIRKNGMFYENGYKQDSEEYIFTRIESFIPYLTETINIDTGVTLEDIFFIIEKDEEIINIIFSSHMGHNPLRPFIEEVHIECMPESREDYDYIEFQWEADQFDYKKFHEYFSKSKNRKGISSEDSFFDQMPDIEGDEVNEINIYVDVHGWGKYEAEEDEKEDAYYGDYASYGDNPTYTSYAIEFTPLYKIKHVPIKLNKKFIIRKETYSDDINDECILVEGEKEFSVFDFFGALLSELTFVGNPEDRDKKWEDIMEDYKDQKEERDKNEEDEEDEEEEYEDEDEDDDETRFC